MRAVVPRCSARFGCGSRARAQSFLPSGMKGLQRRAPALAMLIREAFRQRLSTRQVGRVVSTLTGACLIRDLDEAVREFHRAPLNDEGHSLRKEMNDIRYTGWPPFCRKRATVFFNFVPPGTKFVLNFETPRPTIVCRLADRDLLQQPVTPHCLRDPWALYLACHS